MSPESHAAQAGGGRFPRVSGDEPNTLSFAGVASEFSPRERG